MTAAAIHDIGYQRYDGVRAGRGIVWGALFSDTLRGSYGLGRGAGAKVWPWLLLTIATLPTVIVIVIASLTGASTLSVTPGQYIAQILTLVSVFVAVIAPRAMSRDLRFATVPLYLSRPLTRWDYVSARVGAVVAAVFVVLAVPVTVLALGGMLAELPWRGQVAAWGQGIATSLLGAVVFGAVGAAIAALTPRRGIGTAAVVGFFVVTSGVSGVVTGLLQQLQTDLDPAYGFVLSPWTVVSGLGLWIDRADGAPGGGPVATAVGLTLIAAWLALTAVAVAVLALRYRKVSAS